MHIHICTYIHKIMYKLWIEWMAGSAILPVLTDRCSRMVKDVTTYLCSLVNRSSGFTRRKPSYVIRGWALQVLTLTCTLSLTYKCSTSKLERAKTSRRVVSTNIPSTWSALSKASSSLHRIVVRLLIGFLVLVTRFMVSR